MGYSYDDFADNPIKGGLNFECSFELAVKLVSINGKKQMKDLKVALSTCCNKKKKFAKLFVCGAY